MASYADDVVKLIKAKKLNNIVLIGHSMSGNIILRIQRKVPKRIIGFIGIDNFLEVGSVLTPKQEQETADFFKKFELEYPKVATDYCNSYLFCAQTDTLIKQRVINDVLKSDPNRAIETLRSLFKEGAYERRAFGKMKLKTYLIVSDYHRIQENTLKQYIKSGYNIRYVTNSGHYPMIEQPQQLNERLREILAEIRPK